MLGVGIGSGGVGIATTDDLAVIASTTDAAVEVGGLGATADKGGSGIVRIMHAVFVRGVERGGRVGFFGIEIVGCGWHDVKSGRLKCPSSGVALDPAMMQNARPGREADIGAVDD